MRKTEKSPKGSVAFFGFALAFAAPVFLCNPDYTLLDILPDCIGYLLLTLSLRKLRDLRSNLESAASLFGKAAVVSAAKLLSFLVLNALCDDQNMKTWTLLLLFGFGVGEVLLLVPGWKAFFEGLYHLGFLYDTAQKRGRDRLESVRRLTLTFILSKEILTLLPEFSVLSEHEYIDRGLRWYEYTGMFRTLAILILGVFGIVWLIRMEKFLVSTVRSEEVFLAAEAEYRERVTRKPGPLELRKIALVTGLLTAAALFFCDFRVDGMNLLPDAVGGVCLFFFFFFSRGYGKSRRAGMILSAVYVPVSVVAEFAANRFRETNNIEFVRTDPEVYEAFVRYFPLRAAEAVLLAAALVPAILTVRYVMFRHCGYIAEDMSESYRKSREREVRRALSARLYVYGIPAVLAPLISGAVDYFNAFYEATPAYVFWMASLLLDVIAAVLCFSMTAAVNREAQSRYMLS